MDPEVDHNHIGEDENSVVTLIWVFNTFKMENISKL